MLQLIRQSIYKLDTWLARAEYALMVVLVLLMLVIMCTQVVLRYFFNSPLFWAEEVAVQLLIMLTFIGISYQIYSKSLVSIDFIAQALQGFKGQVLAGVINLTALAVLLVFCYQATEWILRPEVRVDLSPTTQLPRWYNYAVLVASFYVMAWHQLVKLLQICCTFGKPPTTAQEAPAQPTTAAETKA